MDETSRMEAFVRQYSYIVFAKCKIFDLLHDYHKVLVLDSDMTVLKDLSPLFELKGMAWRNGVGYKARFRVGNRFGKLGLHSLDSMPDDWKTPNGGLIYVTDDYGISPSACYETAKRFINDEGVFHFCMDELTISWTAFEHSIPVTHLDPAVWNTFPHDATRKTRIVHFMGPDTKPWNNMASQAAFPTWLDDFDRSQEILPCDNPVVRHNSGNVFRTISCFPYWTRFFDEIESHLPAGFSRPSDLTRASLSSSKGPLEYRFDRAMFMKDGLTVKLRISGSRCIENERLAQFVDGIASRSANIEAVTKTESEMILRSRRGSASQSLNFLNEVRSIAEIVEDLVRTEEHLEVSKTVALFKTELSNIPCSPKMRVWVWKGNTVVLDLDTRAHGRVAFDLMIDHRVIEVTLVVRNVAFVRGVAELLECKFSCAQIDKNRFFISIHRKGVGTTPKDVFSIIEPIAQSLAS